MSTREIKKAYEILDGYCGSNDHILSLQRRYKKYHYSLSDFDVSYINRNHDYQRDKIMRTIKICDIFGLDLQVRFDLDFVPTKVRVYDIIGEMGGSYHCFVQFRGSVPPVLMYVKKHYFIEELHTIDYNSINIDFDQFDNKTKKDNRALREHQKIGVKFMVANRKCILADSMGLGKTTQAVVAAIASNAKKILIISPATLKTTWKREILYYEDKENVQIINGSKWEEVKKFTIINYEILKNFYTVPTEDVFEEEEVVDAYGNVSTIFTPVMVKNRNNGRKEQKQKRTRKKDIIDDCMSKSKLFQEKFDCIIIDEAQKLSNSTSDRYAIVDDFLKRANADFVFLLTGTPLTNNPKNLYNILRLINAPITTNYDYFMMRYCDGHKIKLRTGKEFIKTGNPSNLEELKDRIKHHYLRRLISDIPDMVNKTVDARYYDLNQEQCAKYEQLWQDYLDAQDSADREESEDYRQLVEGGLVRRFLANEMVDNTIQLANEILEDADKIVIVCTFQDEVDKFKAYFKDKSVVYDGRITSSKKKDEAVDSFMNDPKIKVFIGNINAAGVGLTLTEAHYMIFNSYSWSEVDNRQMQDRIWRLTQKVDCEIIYQLWTDSISADMWEKVIYKGLIMDTVIKKETAK